MLDLMIKERTEGVPQRSGGSSIACHSRGVRGSGRRQSHNAIIASRTPTRTEGSVMPRHRSSSPHPSAMPSAASRLPRALTRRPSSQSRRARPKRGWASSHARHFGEPLPSAHAPINRNTVVGMRGMNALMMPMPTLVKPRRRQRNNGMTGTGYRKQSVSAAKLLAAQARTCALRLR